MLVDNKFEYFPTSYFLGLFSIHVLRYMFCVRRTEGRDLVVHFDVRFDPRYQTITTGNIVDILSRELSPETSRYLANLTIEAKSLEVQESLKALNAQISLQPTVSTLPPTTTAPPPRRCSKLDLTYCQHLPYNVSSYPNILGHRSLADVEEDVIAFRYHFPSWIDLQRADVMIGRK